MGGIRPLSLLSFAAVSLGGSACYPPPSVATVSLGLPLLRAPGSGPQSSCWGLLSEALGSSLVVTSLCAFLFPPVMQSGS